MVKAVLADPEDDVFVSCALNAGATYLVSGDQHLLELGQYAGVKILTVREFLEREFPECLAA
jgi:predicted nucleic acid-binding protein